MSTLDMLGILAIIAYYVAIAYVGFRMTTVEYDEDDSENQQPGQTAAAKPEDKSGEDLLRLFLANRGLPLSLGFISMTATWVGAGYINGTAEAVYNYGLVWCQAPLGYALSLVIGGLFFAGRMHATKAFTMLDPFQQHYGCWIGLLLCVPAVSGEVFWTASNLSALGETVGTLTHLNITMIIVVSTSVILLYTSRGGLASVMYTDVFQLCSTIIGLWCCVPFIATNQAIAKISEVQKEWVGVIKNQDVSQILDQLFMTIFGGIPWQVYFQRVLSSDSAFTAKMLSFLSALGCVFLSLPPVIVGATGKSANFTAVGYPGPYNLKSDHRKDIMPYAIRYLTPGVISILGQLAITAAVMSSVDSSMLSASSLITRNVYQLMFRPMATEDELCIALRCTLWVVGLLAMTMALNVQSVFALWTLSSDLVYVLLFPQFMALFFMPSKINAYGAVIGFMIGLMARTLCGEPQFGLPVMLTLPLYDAERGQQFPFRTFCMLLSLASLLGSSQLAAYLFRSGHLEAHQDVWGCFAEEASAAILRSGLSTNAASSAGGGVSAMPTQTQTAGIKSRGRQDVSDNEGTGEQQKDHIVQPSGMSHAVANDKEKATAHAGKVAVSSKAPAMQHRHQSKRPGAVPEGDTSQEEPRSKRAPHLSTDAESKARSAGFVSAEQTKGVASKRKDSGATDAELKGARTRSRQPSVSLQGDENIGTANEKCPATADAESKSGAPMKSQRPAAAHHESGTGAPESKRQSDAESKGSSHSVKLTTKAATGQKTPSKKTKERKGETAPAKGEIAPAKGVRAKKPK
ncbi:high-affinity choline transporter 1-like [Dermacentor silvarum]|uniref:high-affinity choline transporter 1-like n=1 Tax=Dermacentor silvarum TaxID=543639 RepID=UPI0021011EB4|nr:high-affinity choline transporter 1-like [Dermacentor silvarum]